MPPTRAHLEHQETAAPLLGRPILEIAADVLRAGVYAGLAIWAWMEPAGTGAFVFGGFVSADICSWFLMTLTESVFRPATFTIEFLGFAAFLGLLSRAGALDIPIGQEGEALAVFFLSYLGTSIVKLTSHWLSILKEDIE